MNYFGKYNGSYFGSWWGARIIVFLKGKATSFVKLLNFSITASQNLFGAKTANSSRGASSQLKVSSVSNTQQIKSGSVAFAKISSSQTRIAQFNAAQAVLSASGAQSSQQQANSARIEEKAHQASSCEGKLNQGVTNNV